MIRVRFRCIFLSDIILNSHTATEGHAQSLDYIPGANFLGIVAKDYNSFGEKAFSIFHSGAVRFGDAHPAYGNLRSLPIPFSWFCQKGESFQKELKELDEKVKGLKTENIYLHHFAKRKELSKNTTQLKQIRQGFFFEENGVIVDPKHSFSIKSAHDLNKRRSEDEKMYGYDALCSGSEWVFYVDFDDESLMEQVVKKLEGERRLGRSRSAQYGKVKIEEIQKKDVNERASVNASSEGLLFLYAESLLAFFDEYGQPTFQPNLNDLGFDSTEGIKIRWEDSQIRTKIFAPWNAVRKSRDADRVCIDKGSVLVLKVPENFDLNTYATKIQKGIGAYRSEGMGQIIVNPSFLEADEDGHPKIKFTSENYNPPMYKHSGIQEKDSSDELVLKWLEHKHKNNENNSEILKAVNHFLAENTKKFNGISASQWGSIRSIAQSSKNYTEMMNTLFDEQPKEKPKGFLLKGKSEKMWKTRYKNLKAEIEEMKKIGEDCAKTYTINLCSEMAKRASQERKKDESNATG
jgi:hypothetical protein